jgi:hypothetical protein
VEIRDMRKIFYLCSNNPNNYNKVNNPTQFCSNLTTFGCISALILDDYILLKNNGDTTDILEHYLEEMNIQLEINARELHQFHRTSDLPLETIDRSHRDRLCLRFYHSTFPVKSINNKIISPNVPYYNYSNGLYLVSHLGKLV